MASTVSIYKGPVLLGTGSCADGSTSITSFSLASGAVVPNGKRFAITVTQSGTHAGRTWNTRVMSGAGTSTLVVRDPCPFVSA